MSGDPYDTPQQRSDPGHPSWLWPAFIGLLCAFVLVIVIGGWMYFMTVTRMRAAQMEEQRARMVAEDQRAQAQHAEHQADNE